MEEHTELAPRNSDRKKNLHRPFFFRIRPKIAYEGTRRPPRAVAFPPAYRCKCIGTDRRWLHPVPSGAYEPASGGPRSRPRSRRPDPLSGPRPHMRENSRRLLSDGGEAHWGAWWHCSLQRSYEHWRIFGVPPEGSKGRICIPACIFSSGICMQHRESWKSWMRPSHCCKMKHTHKTHQRFCHVFSFDLESIWLLFLTLRRAWNSELVVAPEEDLYCFYFLLHLWKELSSDWGQVKTLMGSLFFC